MYLKKLRLISLLFLFLTVFASLAFGQTSVTEMTYHDLKTDKLMYKGKTESTKANGIITDKSSYFKLDGTLIQTVVTVYREKDLMLISYKLKDSRFGQIEEMSVKGKTVNFFHQKNKKYESEKGSVKWAPNKTTFGAVLMNHIRRDWEGALKGKVFTFDYLVPSRLETIGFRLQKDSETKVNGKDVLVIRLNPDSWLIRQLVNPIYFYLEKDGKHNLLLLKGRVSFKSDDEKSLDLKVVYKR